jgi:hypothetical protein
MQHDSNHIITLSACRQILFFVKEWAHATNHTHDTHALLEKVINIKEILAKVIK